MFIITMSNTSFQELFVQHLPNSFYGLQENDSRMGIISIARQLLNIAEEHLSSNIKSKDIKGIIVPHSGLQYSGLCAASAYSAVLGNGTNLQNIETIVMLGTRHSGKSGLLIPDIDYFKYANHKFKVNNDLYVDFHGISGVTIGNNEEFLSEHSLEIQMPFIFNLFVSTKVTILPILVGELTKHQISKISDLMLRFNSKTLWVINSDLIHANGQYGCNIDTKNLSDNLIKLESKYAINFMKPESKTYQTLLTTHNKYKASICGIAPIILWSAIAGKMKSKLIGKITSYYSSLHATKLPFLTTSEKSFSYQFNPKILFHRFNDMDYSNGTVSYLGAIYINENIINEMPLKSTLTQYEKMALLDFSKRIIININKDTSKHKLSRAWKTPPPFASGTYILKIPTFVTFKNDGSLRGCIGTTAPSHDLLYNIIQYTVDAGFRDKRPNLTYTNPISTDELLDPKLTIDINILKSPMLLSNTGIKNQRIIKKWLITKDGIMMIDKETNKTALFLPSVAKDMNWSKEQTLANLSNKAGLSGEAWKKASVDLYIIPGYEFSNKYLR